MKYSSVSWGRHSQKGFTGHLYKALKDRGVHTFIDAECLKPGQTIGDSLFKAIEGSSVCIPILSPGYATSRWCLMEVAKMVECNKTIIPVFYRVDPSNVRKQKGPFDFEAPFLGYEQNFHDKNKVREWRTALARVGELKGCHLQNDADGFASFSLSLSRFIRQIVEEVIDRVENDSMDLSEHLFGIDTRVEDMMKLLSIEDNDVWMIGMVGMGGIGKTTLSKVVYNKIFQTYDASCFVSDVRERSKGASGLTSLQQTPLMLKDDLAINDVDQVKTKIKQKFEQKKVLIVLDDVNHNDQLEALAGECSWFGSGSRIIITTRDEHLLNLRGLATDQIYRPPDRLNDDDSLRLFSYHAFGKSGPAEEYMELSTRIVSATGGLPLALEVIGSFLCDKTKLVQWAEQLEVLKGKTDVHDRLRISYDGLSKDEKTIFLDIACFFIGEDKNHAISLWKGCGLDAANVVVEALLQRSLIKIHKVAFGVYGFADVFRMHALVRDMGREIADQKYSTMRVDDKPLECILRNRKGSRLVEGLDLRVDYECSNRIPIPLKPMDKLRLLRIFGTVEFKHVPKGLRWLQWVGCGMEYLPNDFNLKNIVVLQLLRCDITCLWKKDMLFWFRKVFKNLMVLNLRSCHRLEATPDFSSCPNLEWLCLGGCFSLVEVHESIRTLRRLHHL